MVKKSCSSLQQFTGRKCMTLFGAILWCHPSHRPCFLDVRRCKAIFALYDVRNTCKRLRYSQTIGRISSVQWRKIGRIWRIQLLFRGFLCVRIEIDQLKCVNCWVIIHCLSVSCKQINHSRFVLVIWPPLQLTSKQWIIIQQFTARADLFLKQKKIGHSEKLL